MYLPIIDNNIYLLFKPWISLMNFKNQYRHIYSMFGEKFRNVDPLNPININITRHITTICSYFKKLISSNHSKNSYQVIITSPLTRHIYFVKVCRCRIEKYSNKPHQNCIKRAHRRSTRVLLPAKHQQLLLKEE